MNLIIPLFSLYMGVRMKCFRHHILRTFWHMKWIFTIWLLGSLCPIFSQLCPFLWKLTKLTKIPHSEPWNFICIIFMKKKLRLIYFHSFDWSINDNIILLFNLYIGAYDIMLWLQYLKNHSACEVYMWYTVSWSFIAVLISFGAGWGKNCWSDAPFSEKWT